MTGSNAAVARGFADPVHDAQQLFRCLLAAFAYPGRIERFKPDIGGSAPMLPSAAAICLTLADHETPLWLDADADVPAVRDYLRFHCGCPIVADPADARLAVVTAPSDMPPLAAFALGDPAYPDRSTTLIIQVGALRPSGPFTLRGPGIRSEACLGIDGLHSGFSAAWAENGAQFPCGVDVVFAAPDAIVALPRTIRMEC